MAQLIEPVEFSTASGMNIIAHTAEDVRRLLELGYARKDGSTKIQYLKDEAEELTKTTTPHNSAEKPEGIRGSLDSFKLEELKELAKARGVDARGLKKKEDYINALRDK